MTFSHLSGAFTTFFSSRDLHRPCKDFNHEKVTLNGKFKGLRFSFNHHSGIASYLQLFLFLFRETYTVTPVRSCKYYSCKDFDREKVVISSNGKLNYLAT